MMTAQERACEINERNRARTAADSALCCGVLAEDPAFWADCGVVTAQELDRYLLIETIFDVYKSVRGIKPRWYNFDDMTTAQLEDFLEGI